MPSTMSASEPTRRGLAASPKKAIPARAAPTAPRPVQTAYAVPRGSRFMAKASRTTLPAMKSSVRTEGSGRVTEFALHLVGGGTRDNLLVKQTAAALNRPVTAGPVEGTAAGNLLVQLIAAGELGGLAEARTAVRRSFPVTTVEPDPALAAAFAARRG